MAHSPVPATESSASGNIAPLRASFLRHLHAENRRPSTRTTYAKAIDQLDAFGPVVNGAVCLIRGPGGDPGGKPGDAA